MDELLTQFLIEGRDLVAQAERDLAQLAREPSNVMALDSLFRAVHTLKGSVGLFDMAPAEDLLHRAEDNLAAARRSREPLSIAANEILLACIDAVDRWIDELEQSGRIAADAAERADRLILRLEGGEEPQSGAAAQADVPAWLDPFRARSREIFAKSDRTLTAFRYSPDPECFFRGDDPLALAAAVPELLHILIVPDTNWASLEAWDPFRCQAVIEGVSGAPIDQVRAVFRLVPDQISLVEVAPPDIDGDIVAEPLEAGQVIRVDAARLDTLASEVGELVVAANGLAHATRMAQQIDGNLAAILRAVQTDIDRIAGRLHHQVAAVRRVALGPSLRRLPRLVREIAEGLGKPIRFAMRGEGLQVDKAIADALFEPLLHIVRNALDHGIELPGVRRAAGKSEEGRLDIDIARQGDEVVLVVRDDGAGIDPERIRAIGVARGLIDADAAAALTDAQALRLIVAAGFSTADQVTDLSGRGVGMDAVQRAVERLRGRLLIESNVGEGSRFELRLPLDAITTRLLIVHAGQDRFGLPLDQIVETARIAATEIKAVGSGSACILRERTVPILDLGTLLGRPAEQGGAARLVITESAGDPVAIRVAAFDTQIDALVRETTGLLAAIPGVSGTTLLGDGTVLLVLDLPELVG